MLQTFRDRSGGLFIKILFGLLVASFALWGVGDVFQNYTSMRPLVSVEGSSVSQEEFLNAYQRVISNVQALSKGKLSIDDIKKMNLYQRVLDDLIDIKVTKAMLNQLGLVVTDEAMRNHIQSMPVFQNDKGQFDRKKLDVLLSNNGLTEATLIKEVRENLLQQQVFGSLSFNTHLSLSYQEILFQNLHQQRVFAVVQVPLSYINVEENPSQSDLEKIYTDHRAQLSKPEYRKLTYMIMDPAVLKERLKISDEQLKEAYEVRRASYTFPETRDVSQLILLDKKQAEEAYEALNNGSSLKQVAAKFRAELRQVDHATPDKFIPAHSHAIFELAEGKASAPLESALGYAVFMVTHIYPEKVQTIDEVKSKLESDLKTDKVNDELYELRNKIDDALASGLTLSEIAKDHQLDLQTISMVDNKGHDENAKAVLPRAYQTLILENAFGAPEGSDTPMLDTADGKLIVIHVDKVIPSVLPALTEIKDKVTDLWKKKIQEEKAATLASTLANDADSLAKLQELARKNKLTFQSLKPLSRVELQKQQQDIDGLPVNLIQSAFALSSKKALYGATEKGFAIIMAEKILPFDLSKEKDKFASFKDSLNAMIQQDLQTSYIAYLRHKDKITINEELLHKLINYS